MQRYEGMLVGTGLRIGLVAARWNDLIVSNLVNGARDALVRHGVAEEAIGLALVPGSFEIPLAAQRMAQSGRYDAIACLGAVIRGATAHYEHVAREVSKGIASVMLETGVPVTFGVLTTDTLEQAIERAGTKAGNKGAEAAIAALEMANLLRAIEG